MYQQQSYIKRPVIRIFYLINNCNVRVFMVHLHISMVGHLWQVKCRQRKKLPQTLYPWCNNLPKNRLTLILYTLTFSTFTASTSFQALLYLKSTYIQECAKLGISSACLTSKRKTQFSHSCIWIMMCSF
jgi:hypothetical protein